MVTDISETFEATISHTISSPGEYTFITVNDKANFVGEPDKCLVPISETMTEVVEATGALRNLTSIDLTINGFVNFNNEAECKWEPNVFRDISGTMCFD